jgi:hypothetical protein
MRRTITRVAVLATTVVATLTVAAVPASATVDLPPIPWSVDNVVITEPQVDFGDGTVLNVWGDPLPGHVIWLIDPDDDSWWPVLDGRIFINNAAGLCARMQIAYYDSGSLLATRSGGTVCSPDNRLNAWNVSLMPYGSDDIDYIYIRLQTVGANGVATTQDSFGPLYP